MDFKEFVSPYQITSYKFSVDWLSSRKGYCWCLCLHFQNLQHSPFPWDQSCLKHSLKKLKLNSHPQINPPQTPYQLVARIQCVYAQALLAQSRYHLVLPSPRSPLQVTHIVLNLNSDLDHGSGRPATALIGQAHPPTSCFETSTPVDVAFTGQYHSYPAVFAFLLSSALLLVK